MKHADVITNQETPKVSSWSSQNSQDILEHAGFNFLKWNFISDEFWHNQISYSNFDGNIPKETTDISNSDFLDHVNFDF